jgi:hypothetical protein
VVALQSAPFNPLTTNRPLSRALNARPGHRRARPAPDFNHVFLDRIRSFQWLMADFGQKKRDQPLSLILHRVRLFKRRRGNPIHRSHITTGSCISEAIVPRPRKPATTCSPPSIPKRRAGRRLAAARSALRSRRWPTRGFASEADPRGLCLRNSGAAHVVDDPVALGEEDAIVALYGGLKIRDAKVRVKGEPGRDL